MGDLAQRILVATDLSPSSELAVETAAIVARQNDADLTLVHVLVPDGRLPMMEDPRSGLVMADDATREHFHRELHALAERKLGSWAERTSIALVISDGPAAGITHYAEHVGADLIVIATHGRTGLARVFNGSVAEAVVRTAPCPVLSLKSAE